DEAIARCRECRTASQFDEAITGLDQALTLYPADARLLALRSEITAELRERQGAARKAQVLEEAQWLVDRGRPDLAAQLLRESCRQMPDQADLPARLSAVQAQLSEWNARREIQDVLARVAALEQLQESSVGLAVVEEALHSHPASSELQQAALNLRDRAHEEERRKKLARRLEAIRQRIATKSWSQALSLLESAREEFPDEPEFEAQFRNVQEELNRSECERVIAEFRQFLSEGEIDQ